MGEITGQILTGLLFGGFAVAGMILPFHYAPGIIFDGRSIVVSMAALFGGPVTAAIATLIAGAYRLGLGGAGTLTGLGVIFTSAVIGVVCYYLRRKNPDVTKPLYLFVLGVIVHISMLLWMLTLPWPLAFEVLDKISIPVMLIFPLGTTFLGLLLVDQEERNYAQEALQESEERLQAIFEANPDPVVVYDTEGYTQFINAAFTELFGWTLDELRGRRIPFVPEDQKEITAAKIAEIYSSGELRRIQSRRLTKQGDIIDIIISAASIKDPEGKPIGLVVNLTDIGEQMKLEAQLRQAQKMEAIGTLAGGIAHDFNNLLMAIQGHASIMLMKKDSSHPDFKHLTGIEGHVESAADLTKQLLGFARGGKYEVRPTDLNELIEKQNRMFGRTKKEITINGKYEENLWSVEIDRGQIEQVLLNLYVNAWQAMPGGGDLYLETENVAIDQTYMKPFSIEPGRYVKISVTDTGVGMDKATREKIFDPFFTTKEMGRGTGLGLASAYGIIKNHGGFINVYSEKGEGSTFNIYLPASRVEVTKEEKVSEDILKGSETVLLVDDESMITEVGEDLLDELGYKVLTAKGGKEAIEIYKKNRDEIDLVILDMIMPDVSGSDTFDSLKEINHDIKVILSSGYSINGQATEIINRGCDGFIQKPFNIKQLSQKLRMVTSPCPNLLGIRKSAPFFDFHP